jgi:hypothetical protein
VPGEVQLDRLRQEQVSLAVLEILQLVQELLYPV